MKRQNRKYLVNIDFTNPPFTKEEIKSLNIQLKQRAKTKRKKELYNFLKNKKEKIVGFIKKILKMK